MEIESQVFTFPRLVDNQFPAINFDRPRAKHHLARGPDRPCSYLKNWQFSFKTKLGFFQIWFEFMACRNQSFAKNKIEVSSADAISCKTMQKTFNRRFILLIQSFISRARELFLFGCHCIYKCLIMHEILIIIETAETFNKTKQLQEKRYKYIYI